MSRPELVTDALENVPGSLWRRIGEAPHRLLMLDYDGTLAPFRVERDQAIPFAGATRLLEEIAVRPATTVAVISGRQVEDLVHLLGPLPVHFFGEHGWERLLPSGRRLLHTPPPEAVTALERAAGMADALGDARLADAVLIERKRCSVVLHTRALPADRARALEAGCEAKWKSLEGKNCRLGRIDGGLELRVTGRDKGSAVRDLLQECPVGTLAVYMGDDLTDEDAFAEMAGRGFGIRVGALERPTLAGGRLRSLGEVFLFLQGWLWALDQAAKNGRMSR